MTDIVPSTERSAPEDQPALFATQKVLMQRLNDVAVGLKGMQLVLDISTQEAFKRKQDPIVEEILESWEATLLVLHCTAAALRHRTEALIEAYEDYADRG